MIQPRPFPRHARTPAHSRLAPLLRPRRHPHHHHFSCLLAHRLHRDRPRRASRHLPHSRLTHQPVHARFFSLLRRTARAAFPRAADAHDHSPRDPEPNWPFPRLRRFQQQKLPPDDGFPFPHHLTPAHALRMSLQAYARRLSLQQMQQQSVRAAHHLPRLRAHAHPLHPPRAQLPPPLPAAQLDRSALVPCRRRRRYPERLFRLLDALPCPYQYQLTAVAETRAGARTRPEAGARGGGCGRE